MEVKTELPNRVAFWRDATFHIDPNGPHLSQWKDHDLFTADQMRSYAESCARMAREEAAKLCEEMAAKLRGEDPNDPSSFVTAEECAAAIRKG